MEDKSCIHFLQWALPRLNMRWKGFKRVRRQVCRRIAKRLPELNVTTLDQYRLYLEKNSEEWSNLDRMCRITISRFYRNRVVFDYLISDVFPELINHAYSQHCKSIRFWSCGCASGEEPYTLALIWHSMFKSLYPDIDLKITATDIDPVMLQRAAHACYSKSSLRELPPAFQADFFERKDESYCLKKTVKDYVRFEQLDIRCGSPMDTFHVILCRNLAFTYFEPDLQKKILRTFSKVLEQNGILITGTHEKISWTEETHFTPQIEHMPFFQKT